MTNSNKPIKRVEGALGRSGGTLRSQQWFGRQDRDGFNYRSWVKGKGVPHDQYQAALEERKLPQDQRQLESGNRRDFGFDIAHHHADLATLNIQIEPKTPQPINPHGTITKRMS